MKKILHKIFILFIPFAIIIIATNYLVDPANVFSEDEYIDKIANIIASGNNADNIVNCNERLLQKKYLQKVKVNNPDVVILGSSRVMEIGSNIYGNKKILNAGVSHANINDLIALAGLMDELKIIPKEVVINIDPFLICKNSDATGEWLTLKEYYRKFTIAYCSNLIKKNIVEEEGDKRKKYYSLIAFDYFQKSIEFLYKGNTKSVINIGKNIPQKFGRYANGSIAYPYKYQHPDTLITANVAKGMGKLIVSEIDNDNFLLLKCLLDYFKKKGTSVTLLMLPYHPDFYASVNQIQKNILITYEAFYKNFAQENNIEIIGSYDAKREGLNNVDFYDTYHCNGNAIKIIFENYNKKVK